MDYSKLIIIACLLYTFSTSSEGIPLNDQTDDNVQTDFWETDTKLCGEELDFLVERICNKNGQKNFLKFRDPEMASVNKCCVRGCSPKFISEKLCKITKKYIEEIDNPEISSDMDADPQTSSTEEENDYNGAPLQTATSSKTIVTEEENDYTGAPLQTATSSKTIVTEEEEYDGP